jgi:hypothetical protein
VHANWKSVKKKGGKVMKIAHFGNELRTSIIHCRNADNYVITSDKSGRAENYKDTLRLKITFVP